MMKLRDTSLPMIIRILFLMGVAILAAMTIRHYAGSTLVYLGFTLAANLLLLAGFRKNAMFFDTFIGIFFWLGFWLKLSIRVTFSQGQFLVDVGNFDGSAMAFDSGLLVSTCAFAALICFWFIRERFLFSYPVRLNLIDQPGLHRFYTENRSALLAVFLLFLIAVVVVNAYLGIYQRGSVTRTTLPFGLNGVFKWLLIFGLASFTTMALKFEYFNNRKQSYLVAFLALIESCLSSVSLLSRGMILNASALLYGFYTSQARYGVSTRIRFKIVCILMFTILFAGSVVAVNQIRVGFYSMGGSASSSENLIEFSERLQSDPPASAMSARFVSVSLSTDTAPAVDPAIEGALLKNLIIHTQALFLDRWVGIEGVFAVSSYPDKGWKLWRSAWQERYSESTSAFYDRYLIDSPYKNIDSSRHHFLSLPGIVAFCFYPGSYLFLFFCMFVAGFFAFLVEYMVYRFGGRNLIFCAMIAQIVVFRYSNFGYVPAQSYLLFGTIFLNVSLIYFVDKMLVGWYRFRNNSGVNT